jgi:hypothetical protein
MIIRMTMKDPDALCDAISDARGPRITELKEKAGLSVAAAMAAVEVEMEEAHKTCSSWMEHGEYLAVEFDTTKGTATITSGNK